MNYRRIMIVGMLVFVFSTLADSFPQNFIAGRSVDARGSANWPQWRGPDSQGVSSEKNLPFEWSESKNILWKTPLPGRGFSSPIVWGKQIFLTTVIEGGPAPETHKAPKHMIRDQEFKHPEWTGVDKLHSFKVLAINRDTGKIEWEQLAYEGTVLDYRHKRGNYAAPTAATDGRYVYAYFGGEGIYCYDTKGKFIWKKAFGWIGTMGMGVGTSPVLFENLVILQCDQQFDGKLSFMIALDKKTGKEVWKISRPVQSSWTTPVIAKAPNRMELITSGNEFLISYDPATGKEYWRAVGLKSHAIATPVVGHGLVILSSGYPAKAVVAIRLGGTGVIDGTDQIVWRFNKGTSYVPSPILFGDYVYLMSDAGILTCLNAKTGEVVYEGGRVPVATKFYGSSPVAFEDKILLTSDDGDTFVIKAGPQHAVLATNTLGEPVRSSIAIADGRLFIRSEQSLFCVGSKTNDVKSGS